MRILIVGGVAAGMSAATRAKRHNPQAEVVVFERGDYISYGACGLPYVIGGEVESFGDLIARTPERIRSEGIRVRLRHEVSGVDASDQSVTVQEAGGRARREPYDRLLLATGVSPVRPDWATPGVAGVHVLRDIPDGQALEASVKSARRAIIVGGGYIGLELAEALRARGLSVVLVERGLDVAGRILDPEYQRRVRQELERHGVDVRCGVEVQALTASHGRVTGVQTSAGLLRGDVVMVAVGVRPNVALARSAGVKLGHTGAIRVNTKQETSTEHIYAAGDNSESVQRVTRRKVHVPLGLTANRMGRVAGVNMAGGAAHFPGIVGSGIFKTFGLGVARTGLSQHEADALKLDAVSVDVESTDHAGYYADAAPIWVRLTAERGTGRLLGAQILGHPGSVKRIDVIAALLHSRGKVHDLAEVDLAYAPPFSSVWDVLLVAAGQASRAARLPRTDTTAP
ncbi:NADH oxidase [Deinococcus irradiatisoli]|uniref:NADH oxidase n=1 Tax=Deinococcus irradiatisoli TaxID=2202254 RepID=A0A2Z3JP29_9DEIO|nr:FAD-dependent oxidoreductase [Deinococcus irradiatisoli]AWN23278.1 NADH oxidase [Deinococcus irradiatisoli]